MNRASAIVIACLLVAGCGHNEQDRRQQSPAPVVRAEKAIIALDRAVQNSEPVIVELENAAGRTLEPETAGGIAGALEKASNVTGKVATGAGIGARVPGPWQGWLAGVAGLATALSGLFGSAAALFRRRQKRAEATAGTMVEAVNSVKKNDPVAAVAVTDAIKAKAIENGTLADVKAAVKKAS